MKTSSAELFHRLGELSLFICVVLLPTAFFLRTYDPTAVKTAVLHWGALTLSFAWLWHGLASGRFSVTASSWPVLAPALLYGAWAIVRFATAEHRLAALPYALNDAAYLAAYLAAFIGFSGARFAGRFAAFGVLTGWAVALYALLQAVGLDPTLHGMWGRVYGPGLLKYRAFSSLGTPEVCATFLALMPPLALTLDQDPEAPSPLRAAALLLLPVSAVAAVLTQAPLGVASYAGLCAVYALLVPFAAATKAAVRAALLAAVLGASTAAAAWGLGVFSGERMSYAVDSLRHNTTSTWRMTTERIFVGHGTGNFSTAYPRFRPVESIRLEGPARNSAIDRPASYLLKAFSEMGAIGGFLWLWLFGAALWSGLTGAAALRRAGAASEAAYAAGFSAAVAGALMSAQFHAAWQLPSIGWFLWTMAGLGAGLSALAARRAPVSVYPLPVSQEVRRALYAPCLLALAVLAANPARWLKAEVDHNSAVFFAKNAQFDSAIALWETIPAGSPHYATSLYFRGNARLEQQHPDEALAYYDRLRSVAPDFAHAHAKRGEALAKLGRWEEAVAARARQAELDPLYVPNLIAWAEAARAAGDLEQARRAVELARAESPDDADAVMLALLPSSRRNVKLAWSKSLAGIKASRASRGGGPNRRYGTRGRRVAGG